MYAHSFIMFFVALGSLIFPHQLAIFEILDHRLCVQGLVGLLKTYANLDAPFRNMDNISRNSS